MNRDKYYVDVERCVHKKTKGIDAIRMHHTSHWNLESSVVVVVTSTGNRVQEEVYR